MAAATLQDGQRTAGSHGWRRLPDANTAHWRKKQGKDGWPADKSLALIPETFRFALAYGFNPHTGRTTTPWRIRNVIRWVRPNPPVGALGDKFRPATSEMVVFCRTDEAGRKVLRPGRGAGAIQDPDAERTGRNDAQAMTGTQATDGRRPES